nr:SJCHGC02450 protein [Schistosoma japonicum]
MDKDELNKHLLDVELNCEMVKSKLSNFKFQTEIASECQAFSFMVNRLKLLIAAYRTVLSEDNPQWNQLTSIQQNCERLKYYEIVILHSSIKNIQSIMDTSCKGINDELLVTSKENL